MAVSVAGHRHGGRVSRLRLLIFLVRKTPVRPFRLHERVNRTPCGCIPVELSSRSSANVSCGGAGALVRFAPSSGCRDARMIKRRGRRDGRNHALSSLLSKPRVGNVTGSPGIVDGRSKSAELRSRGLGRHRSKLVMVGIEPQAATLPLPLPPLLQPPVPVLLHSILLVRRACIAELCLKPRVGQPDMSVRMRGRGLEQWVPRCRECAFECCVAGSQHASSPLCPIHGGLGRHVDGAWMQVFLDACTSVRVTSVLCVCIAMICKICTHIDGRCKFSLTCISVRVLMSACGKSTCVGTWRSTPPRSGRSKRANQQQYKTRRRKSSNTTRQGDAKDYATLR